MIQRFHNLLAFGSAVIAWLFLLRQDVLHSIGNSTQGFAAYYGAAYAVLHGGATDLNNNLAFQGWLTQAGISVREVYQGNTPTLSLLMIPLTPFPPAVAQTIWLLINFVMLIACTVLAIRLCSTFGGTANQTSSTRWWIAAIVPLLLGVRENIQLGQVYILLTLLALVALNALRNGYTAPHPLLTAFASPSPNSASGIEGVRFFDLLAGAAIGIMLLIKPFYGVLALLMLLWSRRFRSALVAVIVVGGVVQISMPLLAGAWSGFLNAEVIISQIPWAGIPANQTLNSLTLHLFALTPDWNAAPLVNLPWLATALYVGLAAVLVCFTLYRARHHESLWLWLPALSLMPILAPVGEVHHEALLLFPVAVAVAQLGAEGKPSSPAPSPEGEGEQDRVESPSPLGEGYRVRAIRATIIIGALLLLIVPWPNLNDLALWGGWHGLLAYPRLYGALLLWASVVMNPKSTMSEQQQE